MSRKARLALMALLRFLSASALGDLFFIANAGEGIARENGKGSPKGGLQQVKKFSVPILFFIGLTLLPEIRFARHHSNLSFRLLIADSNPRAIACPEA